MPLRTRRSVVGDGVGNEIGDERSQLLHLAVVASNDRWQRHLQSAFAQIGYRNQPAIENNFMGRGAAITASRRPRLPAQGWVAS
jgi:hypothetical protein